MEAAIRRVPVEYVFDGMEALTRRFKKSFFAHARTTAPLSKSLDLSAADPAIDELGRSFGYEFSPLDAKRDELMIGCSIRWVTDLTREVPLRLLDRWAKSKEEKGRLDIDQLAEISQLSASQWDFACVTFPEIRQSRSSILAPWSLLNAAQRQAAQSMDGLTLRQNLAPGIPKDTKLQVSRSRLAADDFLGTRKPERDAYAWVASIPGAPQPRAGTLPLPELQPGFRRDMIRR